MITNKELQRRDKIRAAMKARSVTWGSKISDSLKKGRFLSCLTCSNNIWVMPYQEKIGEGKYCSRRCSSLARVGNKISEEVRKKMSEAHKKSDNTGRFRTRTGKYIHRSGYIYVYIGNGDCMPEHRYVVQQSLGRKLTPQEVIHHRNGDKKDNKIENLEIMSKKDHDNLHKERRSLWVQMV